MSIPIDLQVELLGRVVSFERNFSARAVEPAQVVIVYVTGGSMSLRAAAQARAAIERTRLMGGRLASASLHAFDTLAALRAACRGAAIVYFMPGFSRSAIQQIVPLFSGIGTITVSASPQDVEDGVTLGFELQGARPRIVVNLNRARDQKLDFNAQLLRLTRVVR